MHGDPVEALLQLPPDLVPRARVLGEVGLRVHQLLLELLVRVVAHHFVDHDHKVTVGWGVAKLCTAAATATRSATSCGETAEFKNIKKSL